MAQRQDLQSTFLDIECRRSANCKLLAQFLITIPYLCNNDVQQRCSVTWRCTGLQQYKTLSSSFIVIASVSRAEGQTVRCPRTVTEFFITILFDLTIKTFFRYGCGQNNIGLRSNIYFCCKSKKRKLFLVKKNSLF